MEGKVRRALKAPSSVGSSVNLNGKQPLTEKVNVVLRRQNTKTQRAIGQKWVSMLSETFPDLFQAPNTVMASRTLHTAQVLATASIIKMFFCALWKFARLSSYVTNPGLIVVDVVKFLVKAAGGPAANVIEKVARGALPAALAKVAMSVVTMVGAQLAADPDMPDAQRVALGAAVWGTLGGLGQANLIKAFLSLVMMDSYEAFIRRHVMGKNFPIPSRFLSVAVRPSVVRVLFWVFMEGPSAFISFCPSTLGMALTTQAFLETARKLGMTVPATVTFAKVVDFVTKTNAWKRFRGGPTPAANAPPAANATRAASTFVKHSANLNMYGNLSENTIRQKISQLEQLQAANQRRTLAKRGARLGTHLATKAKPWNQMLSSVSPWAQRRVAKIRGESIPTPYNNNLGALKQALKTKTAMGVLRTNRMNQRAQIQSLRTNVADSRVRNQHAAMTTVPLAPENMGGVAQEGCGPQQQQEQ